MRARRCDVRGLGAESLLGTRSVTALEPHLVLDVGGVYRSERVAVVNAHNLAGERGRLGSVEHARQGDGDKDGKKRRQCVAYFALAAALDCSSRNLARLLIDVAVLGWSGPRAFS